MFGLGVLADVVTEIPSLIAGSSVRFELYYGRNGKPRAYYKSYNPTSHYGFLACDGLDEDVKFAEAAYRWRITAGLSTLLPVLLCKLHKIIASST